MQNAEQTHTLKLRRKVPHNEKNKCKLLPRHALRTQAEILWQSASQRHIANSPLSSCIPSQPIPNRLSSTQTSADKKSNPPCQRLLELLKPWELVLSCWRLWFLWLWLWHSRPSSIPQSCTHILTPAIPSYCNSARIWTMSCTLPLGESRQPFVGTKQKCLDFRRCVVRDQRKLCKLIAGRHATKHMQPLLPVHKSRGSGARRSATRRKARYAGPMFVQKHRIQTRRDGYLPECLCMMWTHQIEQWALRKQREIFKNVI